MRVKVICMANRDYRVLLDTECPISGEGNMVWLGYSEEGQLMTFDTEGVLRALNFNTQ